MEYIITKTKKTTFARQKNQIKHRMLHRYHWHNALVDNERFDPFSDPPKYRQVSLESAGLEKDQLELQAVRQAGSSQDLCGPNFWATPLYLPGLL